MKEIEPRYKQLLRARYQELPIIVKNYLFLGEVILKEQTTPQAKEVFREYRLSTLNQMTPWEKETMTNYIVERDRLLRLKGRNGKNPL